MDGEEKFNLLTTTLKNQTKSHTFWGAAAATGVAGVVGVAAGFPTGALEETPDGLDNNLVINVE